LSRIQSLTINLDRINHYVNEIKDYSAPFSIFPPDNEIAFFKLTYDKMAKIVGFYESNSNS